MKFFSRRHRNTTKYSIKYVRKYMEVAVIQGYISNNLDITA
ncbi:hypothetical protein [Clostridium sp. Marseille-Q7071]